MDIEQFRDYCLSFPDAYEDTPFDKFTGRGRDPHSILVFFVRAKMFCYFDINTFDSCTLKCNPDEIAELQERYHGIGRPYNGNPRYWISVAFNSDVPDPLLKALVRRSYVLVARAR